jgi:hypothetical protein
MRRDQAGSFKQKRQRAQDGQNRLPVGLFVSSFVLFA